MPKQTIYDVIVVGSGATGGWAAKELTEKGLRVIMLEAGRKLDPAKDFRMLTFPYELKYRNLIPQTGCSRSGSRFNRGATPATNTPSSVR